jgi:hypothetical protein
MCILTRLVATLLSPFAHRSRGGPFCIREDLLQDGSPNVLAASTTILVARSIERRSI